MTTKPGKTIADLRAVHDKSVLIPNRIREALEALAARGDEWAYEQEFMALVKPGISSPDISKYRDQFVDFWAELPGSKSSRSCRAWFASKKLANKWKELAHG